MYVHEWMRGGMRVYHMPLPPLQACSNLDPTSFIRYGALDNKEEFKMDQEFVKMVRGKWGSCLWSHAHSDPPLSPVHRALCSSAQLAERLHIREAQVSVI